MMIERQKTRDGVVLEARPLAETTNNSACMVVAEISFRGRRPETRIFIRELSYKGMSVGDTVLLIAVLRAVIAESQKEVERKSKAMKRAHMKAINAADQENARVREERRRSRDGMTKSDRAMSQSGRKKCKKSKRSK